MRFPRYQDKRVNTDYRCSDHAGVPAALFENLREGDRLHPSHAGRGSKDTQDGVLPHDIFQLSASDNRPHLPRTALDHLSSKRGLHRRFLHPHLLQCLRQYRQPLPVHYLHPQGVQLRQTAKLLLTIADTRVIRQTLPCLMAWLPTHSFVSLFINY